MGRKAMRRRIAENPEMSGQNYFQEEATKDYAIATSTDPSKIPQYAEFVVDKPAPTMTTAHGRTPLNASDTRLMSPVDRNTSPDRSGLAASEDTLPGTYNRKVLSPYDNGGGYPLPPSAARPPPNRPYDQRIPPVRGPTDRPYIADGARSAYPGPPGERPPGPGLPSQRSNTSLNSLNRPPRPRYEALVPPLPGPLTEQTVTSSVYSDYVPPRRNWGGPIPSSRSMDEGFTGNTRGGQRPERPTIDTYNLDRPYTERPRNRSPPYESRQQYTAPPPPPPASPEVSRRRTSDTGTVAASYYEDVDPRFDDPPPGEEIHNPYTTAAPLRRNLSSNSLGDGQPEGSGPRSPAASTSSHFTSVSQRGINPRWQPPPSQPQFEQYPPRRPKPRNDQMQFLSGNPDFELPVNRGNKRGGGGIPGGISPLSDNGGRYPVPR